MKEYVMLGLSRDYFPLFPTNHRKARLSCFSDMPWTRDVGLISIRYTA